MDAPQTQPLRSSHKRASLFPDPVQVAVKLSRLHLEKDIYAFRKDTDFPIVKILSAKEVCLSAAEATFEVLIEPVICFLPDFGKITHNRLLALFKEILVAYERLTTRFGFFRITPNMIALTPSRKYKLWVHEHLAVNSPQHPCASFDASALFALVRPYILPDDKSRLLLSELMGSSSIGNALLRLQKFHETLALKKSLPISTLTRSEPSNHASAEDASDQAQSSVRSTRSHRGGLKELAREDAWMSSFVQAKDSKISSHPSTTITASTFPPSLGHLSKMFDSPDIGRNKSLGHHALSRNPSAPLELKEPSQHQPPGRSDLCLQLNTLNTIHEEKELQARKQLNSLRCLMDEFDLEQAKPTVSYHFGAEPRLHLRELEQLKGIGKECESLSEHEDEDGSGAPRDRRVSHLRSERLLQAACKEWPAQSERKRVSEDLSCKAVELLAMQKAGEQSLSPRHLLSELEPLERRKALPIEAAKEKRAPKEGEPKRAAQQGVRVGREKMHKLRDKRFLSEKIFAEDELQHP